MRRVFSFVAVLLFTITSTVYSQEAKDHEFSYIGTKKCKKCHLKQAKSWAKTNMANAYDLLKPGVRAEQKTKVGLDPEKDYTADAECLPCHTTGYDKPGGFVSLEETPQRAGVSCEMCHGAGSEYTKDQYMSNDNKSYKRAEVVKMGLVSPVTGDRCTALCHNEKSPFFKTAEPFVFEKRKEEGTHQHYPLKYEHE
ncbi:MAG: cytochrome c family protein [bacterium]